MDAVASESSSDSDDNLRYDEEDDQWEDAEPDGENLEIVSFFDRERFSDIKSMLEYCESKYQFDFLEVIKRLGVLSVTFTALWTIPKDSWI